MGEDVSQLAQRLELPDISTQQEHFGRVRSALEEVAGAIYDHASLDPGCVQERREDFLASFHQGTSREKVLFLREITHFWESIGESRRKYAEFPPDYTQNIHAVTSLMEELLPAVQEESDKRIGFLQVSIPAYAATAKFAPEKAQEQMYQYIDAHIDVLLEHFVEEKNSPLYHHFLKAILFTTDTRTLDHVRRYVDTHPGSELTLLPDLLATYVVAHGVDEGYVELAKQIWAGLENISGLDVQELLTSWAMSNYARGDTTEIQLNQTVLYEMQNVKAIRTLEEARPGSTKVLREMFGIRNFARYHVDDLLEQYDKRNDLGIEYGIVISSMDDYNGFTALASRREGHDPQFMQAAKAAHNNVTVRFIETESTTELQTILTNLDNRYKSKQKAKFAVLRGHGTPGTIQLGAGLKRDEFITPQAVIENALAPLAAIMEDGASLLLESCSTGRGAVVQGLTREHYYHPIAAYFALRGFPTIAPLEDCLLSSVTLRRFPDGRYIFPQYAYINDEAGRISSHVEAHFFPAKKRAA